MLALLLTPWFLIAPPSESDPAPADPVVIDEPESNADLSEAARLFDDGLTRYEAADYEAAIEIFTQALEVLRGQGVEAFRFRGPLLFNIGRAHMRAYEIDLDVEHVRQAQAIFRRFVEQANAETKAGREVAADDVSEAEAQILTIETLLTKVEAEPERERESEPAPAPVPVAVDAGAATRAQRLGIGLTVTGIALLGGGVGVLAWGAGFQTQAQAEVDKLDDLGLPEDDPAFDRGEDFVDQERRKGTAWMAAGGIAAGLGVAGLAVGIQQLGKAKRLRSSSSASVTPIANFDRHGVFIGFAGRF